MDKMFMVSILVTLVGSASMAAFQDAFTDIDNKCVQGGTSGVPALCDQQKTEVHTPLQSHDLTGACTKLAAYKTCLDSNCDPNSDLDTLIATMNTTCGLVEGFLRVLTTTDAQCKRSPNPVTDPCKTVKDDMEAKLQSDSLTDACEQLPGYKMCLLINCASSEDLSNSISTMENKCGMSPSTVTDLQGVLNIIDSLCTKSSPAVTDPCPTEKQEMDTQLQSDSLTKACKKLPDYKTCLLKDCKEEPILTKSIDTMEEKCGSGFMKISVSMLTLFLAAIVNFL